MLSTRMLTKQDIIDLMNQQYPDAKSNDLIACVITIANGHDAPGQQALLFNKELEGLK